MNMQKKKKLYKPGSFMYVLRRIKANPLALASAIIMILMIVLSFISPYILKNDIYSFDMERAYAPPSREHLFGSDELGRDVLARVLYGTRYTMSVGIFSVIISAFFGVLLGAAAGYFGGRADLIIMRFLDILAAFPQLLLAIAISSALGQGLDKCIISLGIAGIPQFARLIRGNILTIRGQEYIEASESINCSKWRIITRHVVPNAISPLIVTASMAIANAGLNASALSFIGLGVKAPTPEWGAMIAASRNYIRRYPHMVLFPGLFIMISVLCLNIIGDTIRDALDPKLRD